MFKRIFRYVSPYSQPVRGLFSAKLPFGLFSPMRFKTYLTRDQPYQPHTPEFLALQLSAMKEHHKARGGIYSITSLEAGREFIGLTGGFNYIYSGVPLYIKNTPLPKEDAGEIENAIKLLGSRWVTYLINEPINCILHLRSSGVKCYFVDHMYLDIKDEPSPIPTFRFK